MLDIHIAEIHHLVKVRKCIGIKVAKMIHQSSELCYAINISSFSGMDYCIGKCRLLREINPLFNLFSLQSFEGRFYVLAMMRWDT